MSVMKVIYVGDQSMVKNPGDFYRTNDIIYIRCPECGDMKNVRYANFLSSMKGVLLTLNCEFFCQICKFKCNIKEGDVSIVQRATY